MAFCGQDSCTVDANGRIKLGLRLLSGFSDPAESVVLHCLPEGALGLYPLSAWRRMRGGESPDGTAAASIVTRRQLRRFGALSQMDSISRQGRVTIPVPFRPIADLPPGAEAVLVGVEIGVEVWNALRWKTEFETLLEHEREKADREMRADLNRVDAVRPVSEAEDRRGIVN